MNLLPPLAERMRPKTLAEYHYQAHLVGDNAPIKNMLTHGMLASMIFWGPPGTGKTTLAEIIAAESKREHYALSAINSGVKEVREVLDQAKKQNLFSGKSPILFIDEIHRFNKSQQDSLLQAVEKGWVVLIGATTENPSFEVVPALLSRCQVYVLHALDKNALHQMAKDALKKDPILQKKSLDLAETEALIHYSGGDARKLFNALELVIQASDSHLNHKIPPTTKEEPFKITNEWVKKCIQQNPARYDKNGEQHYDIISAFIKSIRGSDPNAALYWLARMLVAGEDLKFIARRMLISAAEDIGLANPNALILAQSTFQSVAVIGYPEARIVLSQCAVYLATSAKSNSTYLAIDTAIEHVKKTGDLPVPLHLRNAPTALMQQLNYGTDYQYAHQYDGNFVRQEFLPPELSGTVFYAPGNNPKEKATKEYLKKLWGDAYDL